MAVQRYVVTQDVTVPAGTPSAPAADGTVSYPGPGAPAAWAEGFPVTFQAGQVIELDPATTAGAALQAAIGVGNLRAYVQGTDDAGHAALAN